MHSTRNSTMIPTIIRELFFFLSWKLNISLFAFFPQTSILPHCITFPPGNQAPPEKTGGPHRVRMSGSLRGPAFGWER